MASGPVARKYVQQRTGEKNMKDTLENAIGMLVRVQERLRKDGIALRFQMTWDAIPLKPKPEKDCPPKSPQRR